MNPSPARQRFRREREDLEPRTRDRLIAVWYSSSASLGFPRVGAPPTRLVVNRWASMCKGLATMFLHALLTHIMQQLQPDTAENDDTTSENSSSHSSSGMHAVCRGGVRRS